MSVKVSGPVLSSLFFEQNNSDSDAEGFLLGQIHSHVTNVVTDSQMNGVKEETVTYVHAFVPCSTMHSWYRSSGAVIADKLKAILKDKHKEVVGWYRFRRNTSDIMTMREHCIHKHLLSAFPGVVPQNFLFFLSSCISTPNLSTHTFDHSFLSYIDSRFKGVPVSIINLGDTPQSEYRNQPSNAINNQRGRFAQTVKSFQDQFCDQQGKMHSVSGVHTFNSVIHQQLADLCSTVTVSENQLKLLQQDVDELEQQLTKKLQPNPPLLRRNCQKEKTPLKTKALPPLPGAESSPELMDSDLIVLDADVRSKDTKQKLPPKNNKTASVPIKQVAILNPHVSEQAPSKAKTRMAANFEVVLDSDSSNGASSPVLVPQKSKEEPSLSKSRQTEEPKKMKKNDSFSFVDDLMQEHKTLSRSNSNKSTTSTTSKASAQSVDVSSLDRKRQHSKSSKIARSHGDGPSTAFDCNEPMELEVSSSPTF